MRCAAFASGVSTPGTEVDVAQGEPCVITVSGSPRDVDLAVKQIRALRKRQRCVEAWKARPLPGRHGTPSSCTCRGP